MRLRFRAQYRRMSHAQNRYTGQWIVVKTRPNKSHCPKLGITVTRRFGKSHQRNRFKRLVREAFRLSCNQFFVGIDILVQPRSLAVKAHMEDIRTELMQALINSASSHEQ
ncbi:MAG: ribonuclease P protein component [Alphaproteobacteria bacterium]|nr:ribonuclease P protein component [Alphaproteobacteria bacterium]